MSNKQKDVLVIFKTHLDIGYTDLAANVAEKYIKTYIPNAIKAAYELKDTDTPFIWTTGSWLIWEALKYDEDGSVQKAINDGLICWHGLPFTTHTEFMSEKLFEYGLSISKKLDKRFKKNTIAAKMTDVPGHTLGMVPYMKKAGIEFLHIGVNPATPVPDVPALFKWRCGNDEITVMYQQSYGSSMEFDDFVVYFAHTNDNCGPQSGKEIVDIYNKIKAEFSNCKVKAATLDDLAFRLKNKTDLPVIDKEIGDTWIHGAGTDPKKVAMYRELLRYIEKCDIEDKDLETSLLLVPEHTWGMCQQVYFNNTDVWYSDEIEKAKDTEQCRLFESSWREQRDYVKKAADILGYTLNYKVLKPNLEEYEKIQIQPQDFEISWQLFDLDDYTTYLQQYTVVTARNISWLQWDFLKFGMPDIKGGIYAAKCSECYKKDEEYLFKMEFEEDITKEFGLPYFWVKRTKEGLSVAMFDKKYLRLPHAFWLKFKGFEENWEINKLGQWIKPENIIDSPLITAFGSGIRNFDTEIESEDAVLAAPYGRNLLRYAIKCDKQDMYFNLYNNIWNTNFPMWYNDDTLYRFKITSRDK